MKHCKIIIISIVLGIFGCNNTYKLGKEANDNYFRLKSKFNKNIVSHFPKYLTSPVSSTVANTSIQENNIGFFLYEYEMPSSSLDSIANDLNDRKIEKYISTDTCLLIVNRFSKIYTGEQGIIPSLSDSLLINMDCYDNVKPIPSFTDYKGDNLTSCGLDNTFRIYILEARSGLYFEEYKLLKPFIQMPSKWSNGYSKGIAISKTKHAIVYWSIVW